MLGTRRRASDGRCLTSHTHNGLGVQASCRTSKVPAGISIRSPGSTTVANSALPCDSTLQSARKLFLHGTAAGPYAGPSTGLTPSLPFSLVSYLFSNQLGVSHHTLQLSHQPPPTPPILTLLPVRCLVPAAHNIAYFLREVQSRFNSSKTCNFSKNFSQTL